MIDNVANLMIELDEEINPVDQKEFVNDERVIEGSAEVEPLDKVSEKQPNEELVDNVEELMNSVVDDSSFPVLNDDTPRSSKCKEITMAAYEKTYLTSQYMYSVSDAWFAETVLPALIYHLENSLQSLQRYQLRKQPKKMQ